MWSAEDRPSSRRDQRVASSHSPSSSSLHHREVGTFPPCLPPLPPPPLLPRPTHSPLAPIPSRINDEDRVAGRHRRHHSPHGPYVFPVGVLGATGSREVPSANRTCPGASADTRACGVIITWQTDRQRAVVVRLASLCGHETRGAEFGEHGEIYRHREVSIACEW